MHYKYLYKNQNFQKNQSLILKNLAKQRNQLKVTTINLFILFEINIYHLRNIVPFLR